MTKKEKQEIIEEIINSMNELRKVYVEVCREDVKIPTYENFGDAGMDLRAAEETIIKPGETKLVPTGLKVAIPNGYEIQIRPRSGISLKTPLRIVNTPSTIDSGYKGEICVIVQNTSKNNDLFKDLVYTINETENKNGTYVIKKNDRIAQMVLCKYEKINFVRVEKDMILKIGTNRNGGFGSTGVK